MSSPNVFKEKIISPGKASGLALVTKEHISLRGFVNLEQGTFTAGTYTGALGELDGVSFAGAVLIFPSSNGSTVWSITLDLTCRFGNSPAAMINSILDPFVTPGCILQGIPLVRVENLSIFDEVKIGDMVTVDVNRGEVVISKEFLVSPY